MPEPVCRQRGTVTGMFPSVRPGGFLAVRHFEQALPADPHGPPAGIRHPVRPAG
jgi:hypothetical protein